MISSVGFPAFTALFRKFSSAVIIRRTSRGLSATTTFCSFFQNNILKYSAKSGKALVFAYEEYLDILRKDT